MAIRLPLKTVLTYDDVGQTGATSVAGGVAKTFTIPQDADTVVVKLTASVIAGAVSATLQTTDDGGTTWYDVSRTSVVSNANGTTAVWCSGNVNATGISTAQNGFPTASILTVGIRSTAASTLAANQISGLPILSQLGRVFLIYTAAVTSTDLAQVEVKVNSQSATA
jgi:hypothetical protein